MSELMRTALVIAKTLTQDVALSQVRDRLCPVTYRPLRTVGSCSFRDLDNSVLSASCCYHRDLSTPYYRAQLRSGLPALLLACVLHIYFRFDTLDRTAAKACS